MVALTRYRTTRTAECEDSALHLEACLSDYATFAATVLRLDEEANISSSHNERRSRRDCSAGVYPPRCAYRMHWSYARNPTDVTTRAVRVYLVVVRHEHEHG